MIGNRSKKVIALHYMIKWCIKYETELKNGKTTKQHDDIICAYNYLGSSKGMEAHGILQSNLVVHGEHNCILDVIVMHDNSSSLNILQWDLERRL
jgi:hypothetical protein